MTPAERLSAKSKKSWRMRKRQEAAVRMTKAALDDLQRLIAPLDISEVVPPLIPTRIVVPRLMFDATVQALDVSRDASSITIEGITYVPSQMLPIIKSGRKRS